jgi:hypothetical protein
VLSIAHALLIITAVDIGAPSPGAPLLVAASPITSPDRAAADQFIKDGFAWTRELTTMGEKLGHMLVDVLDGKQTGAAVRAEIKRVSGVIAERLEQFKARPSPAFPEMVAFRTLFLDYLVWEGRVFGPMMNEALKIVEDKKQARDARADALIKKLQSFDAEEQPWKARLQTSMKSVYAAVNPTSRK